jgi:hypothetical protein
MGTHICTSSAASTHQLSRELIKGTRLKRSQNQARSKIYPESEEKCDGTLLSGQGLKYGPFAKETSAQSENSDCAKFVTVVSSPSQVNVDFPVRLNHAFIGTPRLNFWVPRGNGGFVFLVQEVTPS